MEDEFLRRLWVMIRFHLFMKLGSSLWDYIFVHEDYWHRVYGISFTYRQDFRKCVMYDLSDMNGDREAEIK